MFIPVAGVSQNPLTVSGKMTPRMLVENVLLSESSGIEILDVEYEGHAHAIGAFSHDSKYYLIRKGIVLTTGNIEDIIGPNSSGKSGVSNRSEGSRELDAVSNGFTFDACRLSFDFIADFDSIRFNYVFASEEYPEYVNKHVNDIFAFFIKDLSTGVSRNLAVLPGGIGINVDNINNVRNSQYYIPNARWNPYDIMQWDSARQQGELALAYQFDGFTTLLSAGCGLERGKKYRITFVIADVGDRLYDSAVFLEHGSFRTSKKNESQEILEFESSLRAILTDRSVEMMTDGNSLTIRLHINFAFDEWKISDKHSMDILHQVIRVMRQYPDIHVEINGNTDNVGSDEYNLNLSLKRSRSASEYMHQYGIDKNRITVFGHGDHIPISDNFTETGRWKNRRIEFKFYLKER